MVRKHRLPTSVFGCNAIFLNDHPSSPGWSGGYDGGKYEKQRQPAEHDNLLKAAGIEFVWHLTLPLIGHMAIRIPIIYWPLRARM
jgi:hypothetical protein